MRLIKALITLYVSLWKAWSQPNVVWTGPDNGGAGPDHPYAFARPMRSGAGLGVRSKLYDQEREDDTYHDHDWPWAEPPEDEDIHSLNARFDGIIDKMREIPGINAEDLRLAYLGFDIAYPTDGDVEADFQAWMDTPEGKFQAYLAKKGDTNADA